jgi:hypothetical protein
MGYKLETTALISIDNYNAFRIRCIMLILENLNIKRVYYHMVIYELKWLIFDSKTDF